jgi:hypothetical protein
MTRSGEVRAADLTPGARVVTRDGGFRTLAAVELRQVEGVALVRIAAGALGDCRPERDLIVAPGQPVLVRGARALAQFGRSQALAPAEGLVDGAGVARVAPEGAQTLVTLRFEGDHVIYASGLELLSATGAQAVAA